MNDELWLRAYGAIAKRHGLPSLESVHLQVQCRAVGPEDGAQAVLAARPVAGWLQYQSTLVAFRDGAVPAAQADWGALLAAEVADAEGRSLRLGPANGGGLQLAVAAEVPPGGGEALVRDEVEHLGGAKAPGRLRYRRYWRRDPQSGLVPVYAAFQGFLVGEPG